MKRLRFQSWYSAILCAILATTLAGCPASSDDHTAQSTLPPVDSRSNIAYEKCPIELPDNAAICGVLTVAEDRADKSSRLLGLPFAVFPARVAQKQNDPIVLYTGGPGPSALRLIAGIPAADLLQNPLRQNRDFIVMNQRGTDLTRPSNLYCPELDLDFQKGERFASVGAVVDAGGVCRDRLRAGGANLDAYDSVSNARDMEDLRVLLGRSRGFTKWNVVGSSYGSRLALVSMREYASGIRSAVLDGPFPHTVREIYEAGTLDAIAEIAAACEAQPSCAAAFPQLKSRFASAIEALETNPAIIGEQRVSGHLVLNLMRLSLSGGEWRSVPLFMNHVINGNYAAADAILPIATAIELAPNPEGMYYSVTCRDDDGSRGVDLNELPVTGLGWPDSLRKIAAAFTAFPSRLICPVWLNTNIAKSPLRAAVISDLPSLITVGQFDASTPVSNGKRLAQDLSRSQLVVLPGKGHGLLEFDACVLTLAANFIDKPDAKVDSTCATPSSADTFILE